MIHFTENTKKHADACRFCWMCHHICPVGNATGLERNTARARGLAISLMARGAADLTDDILDNMYECCLCEGCASICITGWNPMMFVKEVRTKAALEGRLPAYVDKLLGNFEETGNVYGRKDLDTTLVSALSHHTKKEDTLFFLGAEARYRMPANAINAIEAMEKTGVPFTLLQEEPDSAWCLDTLLGATAETKDAMVRTAAVLKDYKTVVVYDPHDTKIFVREYSEYGVRPENVRFVTFTAFLAAHLNALTLSKRDTTYTYQDNAMLVRELSEEEAGRVIINACGNLAEMVPNKKETMYAGNLLMNEYLPDTMKLVASRRWKDAVDTGAQALVCASISEYALLLATKPESMDLVMVEDLIVG